MRYYNTEPFGFVRQEARCAQLQVSLWSLHGHKSQPRKYTEPSHWMYGTEKETDEDDEDEINRLQGG